MDRVRIQNLVAGSGRAELEYLSGVRGSGRLCVGGGVRALSGPPDEPFDAGIRGPGDCRPDRGGRCAGVPCHGDGFGPGQHCEYGSGPASRAIGACFGPRHRNAYCAPRTRGARGTDEIRPGGFAECASTHELACIGRSRRNIGEAEGPVNRGDGARACFHRESASGRKPSGHGLSRSGQGPVQRLRSQSRQGCDRGARVDLFPSMSIPLPMDSSAHRSTMACCPRRMRCGWKS